MRQLAEQKNIRTMAQKLPASAVSMQRRSARADVVHAKQMQVMCRWLSENKRLGSCNGRAVLIDRVERRAGDDGRGCRRAKG